MKGIETWFLPGDKVLWRWSKRPGLCTVNQVSNKQGKCLITREGWRKARWVSMGDLTFRQRTRARHVPPFKAEPHLELEEEHHDQA